MKATRKKTRFESNERFELRLLRRKLGLRQKDMAIKLGVAQATYEKYERGERRVPVRVLEMLRDKEQAGIAIDAPIATAQPTHARPTQAHDEATPMTESAPLSFWQATRAEARQLREKSYSRAAQALIDFRNGLFVAATFYVVLQHLALSLGQPLTFEKDGIDYVFLGAYFIIWTLIIPLLQEIPILKAVSRLAARPQR